MTISTLTASFHLLFRIDDECGNPHPHNLILGIPGLEMNPEQIIEVIEAGVVGSQYQWEIGVIPDLAKTLRRIADPQTLKSQISADAPPCTILWGCNESPEINDVSISIDFEDQLIWVDAKSYAISDFWKHTEEVIKLLRNQ